MHGRRRSNPGNVEPYYVPRKSAHAYLVPPLRLAGEHLLGVAHEAIEGMAGLLGSCSHFSTSFAYCTYGCTTHTRLGRRVRRQVADPQRSHAVVRSIEPRAAALMYMCMYAVPVVWRASGSAKPPHRTTRTSGAIPTGCARLRARSAREIRRAGDTDSHGAVRNPVRGERYGTTFLRYSEFFLHQTRQINRRINTLVRDVRRVRVCAVRVHR